MKLTRTIKKIMALGTGATMVGATLLSAGAADLANYPAPFIKDGKLNAVLIVGERASAKDVVGVTNIATSLQFAARTQKTVSASGGASVTAVGDSWKVGTSSKNLEVSENLAANTNDPARSAAQEEIRNITTFIDKDDLNVLAKGTFRNDKGNFDYEQFLYFDELDTPGQRVPRSVVYTTDDNDVTATFFYVPDGKQVARYALEFTTSAESDVTDSAGTASTTGTYLWNFEGETIKLLGVDYSIVKARRTTSTGNSAELTLMGGAVRDILELGETKTYTVGGKDYEVKLSFVSASNAKFTVNGETTDSLAEGSTDTLTDSTLLGVRDILYQDFAGGVQQAEFYLGAEKVFLKDTNLADAISSNTLQVAEETIDNSYVLITGTDDNSTLKLETIQINVTADDDIYIPAGGKLSALLDEPGALLSSWDVEYAGLAPVSTEEVKIKPSGSDDYDLQFVDGSGNKVTVPLMHTTGGTTIKLGDNNDDLILTETPTANISKNDYFVVTDYSQDIGERRTYVYRYKGSTLGDTKVVKFQNVGTGETEDRTWSHVNGNYGTGSGNAQLKVGGATFAVWNVTAGADFDVVVDLDGDGNFDNSVANNFTGVSITTKSGAVINVTTNNATLLGNASTSAIGGVVNVTVTTPNTDHYDNLAPSAIGFSLTAASGEVGAAEATHFSNHNYITPENEDNTNYAYTTYGAKVKWDNPSSDPDTISIEYPTQQRLPQVFVTTPGVVIQEGSAGAEGDVTYYETSKIEVGATRLDTDAGLNVQAQNSIIVGGPCANTAAASVLGNPANCVEGFEEGKAMVKLVEHTNGNVALLVAGYSADDTRRATRVVADYETWKEAGKLSGSEVEVSGTSFTDITVGAPAMKEAPAADADAPAASDGSNSTDETA